MRDDKKFKAAKIKMTFDGNRRMGESVMAGHFKENVSCQKLSPPSVLPILNRKSSILGLFTNILFAVVLIMLVFSQSMAAEKIKPDGFSENKPYIVDIALDGLDIPFLLDNKGYVWTFNKPLSREGLIRLPNLRNIKKIAPWIALDKDGENQGGRCLLFFY